MLLRSIFLVSQAVKTTPINNERIVYLKTNFIGLLTHFFGKSCVSIQNMRLQILAKDDTFF